MLLPCVRRASGCWTSAPLCAASRSLLLAPLLLALARGAAVTPEAVAAVDASGGEALGLPPKDTKALACEECRAKAPYLKTPDPCTCFASKIYTSLVGRGSAAARARGPALLAAARGDAWRWHCKPVTGSGAWEQC